MTFNLPKNPIWYAAIIILFLPFVLSNSLGDSWVVRFFAYGLVVIGFPLTLLYYGLSRYLEDTTSNDAPLIKKYGKKRIVMVWRILFVSAAVLFALPLLPNLVQDIVYLVHGNKLEIREGQVTDKSGGPISGYFYQTIVFDTSYVGKDNTFNEFIFPPDYFGVGYTYEFQFLPHSRLIVQATRIPLSD